MKNKKNAPIENIKPNDEGKLNLEVKEIVNNLCDAFQEKSFIAVSESVSYVMAKVVITAFKGAEEASQAGFFFASKFIETVEKLYKEKEDKKARKGKGG